MLVPEIATRPVTPPPARRRRWAAGLALSAALAAPLPAAANGWEHWGIPRAFLLEALQDPDPGYRALAAHSLGARKERAAVEPLVAMLAAEEQPVWLLASVIEALGRIGDARAAAILEERLRTARREEVRAQAAAALGRIGAAGSLPSLLAAFRAEEHPMVRAAIVDALGSFREPPSLALLGSLVREETDPALRRKAIAALGRTGSGAATATLVERLGEVQGPELGAILEALARIADSASAPALGEVLRAASDPQVKVQASMALAATRHGSAVPALVALLDHEVPSVRSYAVAALADAGDARAAEPLRRLYWQSAREMRGGDPLRRPSDAASYLAAQQLRVQVARALVNLDPEGSLAVFTDAVTPRAYPRDSSLGLRLNVGHYALRRLGIVGLGYSGSPDAGRRLRDGPLHDPDFRIRSASVRALGVLGGSRARRGIVAAASDPAAEVRWVAAMALGRLQESGEGWRGDGGALGALRALLGHDHPQVRRQSVLSLGYLGDADSAARVSELAASDESEAVRTAAAATLRRLANARRAP